jgi:hypothetical protein
LAIHFVIIVNVNDKNAALAPFCTFFRCSRPLRVIGCRDQPNS